MTGKKKELLTAIITMCKYLKENMTILKRETDNAKEPLEIKV